MTDDHPMLLPDVDPTRYVHGIVSLDPPTVQCDGCGYRFSHPRLAMAVILSGITFRVRPLDPTRRLCAECRKREGWEDA